MAQEFVIKSQDIEDKINQLLPSQGGFQAGVDFSASTMVVPIIDLTETAEGATARQDLQTASSLNSSSAFVVNNTSTTIITTTGYFRLIGCATLTTEASTAGNCTIQLGDGVTNKGIWRLQVDTRTALNFYSEQIDLVVFINAGQNCNITCTSGIISGSFRQIADINGNLVNPN